MGAPLGNQNATKGRLWHQAILRALDKRGGGDRVKALDELAEKLLQAVETGDLQALKEFGDRLDGKPKQQIEASGPDGGPIQFEKVAVVTGVPD